MAEYPSNLAKKFSPTEQFLQHILPLLPLYNAQWWGYESLAAIVLVLTGPNISDFDICCNKTLWINSLISYTVFMMLGVSYLLYMVFIAEV